MSRAGEFAARFEDANREAVATVGALTEAQWGKPCAAEGWTIGVVAHHLAANQQAIVGLAQSIASGKSQPSFTLDAQRAANAEHAQQAAHCTQAETLELMRSGGVAVGNALRSLNDEELARRGIIPAIGYAPVSAERIIEHVLIDHFPAHLASIRTAIA